MEKARLPKFVIHDMSTFWFFMDPLSIEADDVQYIVDENPDLTEMGWRCGPADEPLEITPEFIQQVRTATAYFATLRRVPANQSSYGLKHEAERWGKENGLEPYVCNCAAIIAGLLLGYRPVRAKYRCMYGWFRKPRK